MNKLTICVSLAAALVLGPCVATSATLQPAYRITNAVPLGAPDRWDYVQFDPEFHRVFVAHNDRLTVVDADSGKVVGEVTGIPGGTHGIAISHATGEGFTDDGNAGQVIAFDLKSLQIVVRIKVDLDADAMVFDPVSRHVFVVEGDPKKVTVIDPKTHAVIAAIDGGGGLEYAVADGYGSLFVAGEEKRDVVRINTRTNKVVAHWPISDCASPHGAAIDPAANRLFISCENQRMVVVDTNTGHEVATAAIGRGTDAAAFDPIRHLAFSSNGVDGTLSVIRELNPQSYEVAATVQTQLTGRTMSIDPRTGRIFIAAADADPSPTPGGRAHAKPGTLKLLFLDPVQ